jgi:hypothetical protein
VLLKLARSEKKRKPQLAHVAQTVSFNRNMSGAVTAKGLRAWCLRRSFSVFVFSNSEAIGVPVFHQKTDDPQTAAAAWGLGICSPAKKNI